MNDYLPPMNSHLPIALIKAVTSYKLTHGDDSLDLDRIQECGVLSRLTLSESKAQESYIMFYRRVKFTQLDVWLYIECFPKKNKNLPWTVLPVPVRRGENPFAEADMASEEKILEERGDENIDIEFYRYASIRTMGENLDQHFGEADDMVDDLEWAAIVDGSSYFSETDPEDMEELATERANYICQRAARDANS